MEKIIEAPALGQPWPEHGGIRAAHVLAEDGSTYDIVVLTDADGKPIVLEDKEWGEYGEKIKGADSMRDGLANTDAMLKADIALAKEVRAHGDGCYLGAICEVHAVHANIGLLFPQEWFWSSTQIGANGARCQGFEGGDSGWDDKSGSYSVFVLRRVPR